MQGESRVTQQRAARMRGWQKASIALFGFVAGLWVSGASAQFFLNQPPTVSVSASPNSISIGASTVLTATAADIDGTITRVIIYDGSTILAQISSAPYTYTYTPSTSGAHTITAVAYDNMLASATSKPVTLTVGGSGNVPPTVTLSAAPTMFPLGGSTTLTAVPTDSDGTISKVMFYAGGTTLIGTVTSAPWKLTWTPAFANTYSVTAVAYDNFSATGTSNAVSVKADNGLINNPPMVSLAASATSVSAGTPVTLTATASDSDGTVSKVEFYNGATLLGSDTTSPYTFTFTPSGAGSYSLTAKAYDNANAAATSNAVVVTATGISVGGNNLPRITLSLSNTLFSPGATVTLTGTAAATAPATVAKVSFFMNGTKLVDDMTAPYTTTATLPNAGNYTFYAQVTDTLGQTQTTLNQVAVAQTAPAVATTNADIVRLLNQATFGFSQAEAARVNQLGIAGWINDQMSQPISGYPDPRYYKIQLTTSADCTTAMPGGGNYPGDSPQAVCARDQLSLAMVQRDFFTNAVYAQDQLRQRVAWALSQILVISGATVQNLTYAHAMARYQNILFNNAFGNYETLLRQVTYSPAMGDYLDAVNNDRPAGTRVPNENYAREIMQLFSINLVEMNSDGTPILDATGQPIPTYDQNTIKEFARVFTGYTYANSMTQTTANAKQNPYYAAPMVPYPTTANAGHDPNAKTLLNGTVLPAGQTGQQDIDAAVRNVFMHPNTGVYVGRQLIQRLVTGNPSGAYLSRVVAVFNDNGQGVRGDLAAVVKAILLDPEARGPAKVQPDFGSLREPVLVITSLLRALNGLTDGNRLAGSASNLGQNPYFAPTVFNYYMPDNLIPGTSILGPEFGIHTTVTAVGRANLVYSLVYGGFAPDTTVPSSTGTRLFLAPFEAIADQPAAMVSLINQQMTGGQFPASLEATIVTAVNAVPVSATLTAADRTNRARMAVYLMASSYDFQVQR